MSKGKFVLCLILSNIYNASIWFAFCFDFVENTNLVPFVLITSILLVILIRHVVIWIMDNWEDDIDT